MWLTLNKGNIPAWLYIQTWLMRPKQESHFSILHMTLLSCSPWSVNYQFPASHLLLFVFLPLSILSKHTPYNFLVLPQYSWDEIKSSSLFAGTTWFGHVWSLVSITSRIHSPGSYFTHTSLYTYYPLHIVISKACPKSAFESFWKPICTRTPKPKLVPIRKWSNSQ